MFCNTFAVGNMPKLPHNVDVVPRGIREKMTHCCHYESRDSRHEGAYSPNIVCHPLSVCLLPFLFHVSNRFAIHSRSVPDILLPNSHAILHFQTLESLFQSKIFLTKCAQSILSPTAFADPKVDMSKLPSHIRSTLYITIAFSHGLTYRW